MKIVILYSAGLDSLLMHHFAKMWYPDTEIKCLYYKHGADSEDKEIALLPDFVEVRVIDWLGENCKPVSKKSDPFAGNIYIPGRNMVFATLAASQELPDQIWMGVLRDENNEAATDKNSEFLSRVNGLIGYVLSPFHYGPRVVFPLDEHGWTKSLALRAALDSGLSVEDVKKTVSCWHFNTEKNLPCGECKQCLKRALVFKSVGLEEEHVAESPLVSQWGKYLQTQYLSKAPLERNADEEEMTRLINLSILFGACTDVTTAITFPI